MSEDTMQDTSVPVTTVAAEESEKLADTDKMALELAKSRKLLALAQAEKALAQNESAELAYKYTVLQLYMKYGLTAADALTEDGKILRGGALQNQQS